jgi:hypothetical protein
MQEKKKDEHLPTERLFILLFLNPFVNLVE